ncbi:MAG: PGPGW domain-containing protein [Candidatus Nanopelagicales bacterium]
MPHAPADPDHPDQDPTAGDDPVERPPSGDRPSQDAAARDGPTPAEGPGAGTEPGTADPDGTAGEEETARASSAIEEETLRQHLREASGAAFRKVEQSAPPGVSARLRAFRERIRSRRSLDTAWRTGVFALGATLLVAGAVMMLIPGPGWATLILGLVVLGSEFTWATRALNPVKDAARKASAVALDPRRRRCNLIIGATLGVLAGLVLWWYLRTYGVTIDPIMAWINELTPW